MRTIFQSLAWKEWHEHKWKLLSLTAILCAIASMGLVDPDQGTLLGLHVALVMGIVPLAIFIGLGTAAGERSRGTLTYLQSLPVPMWRVSLQKMLLGMATIFVPALLTVAFVFIWLTVGDFFGFNDDAVRIGVVNNALIGGEFVLVNNWFVNSVLMLCLVAGGFYIWTIAAGVNRKDEVSAGAIALTVIIGWSVLLFSVWTLIWKWQGPFSQWPLPERWLAVVGLATVPGGLATLKDATDGDRQYLVPAICVAAVTHIALALWYIRRFGRVSDLEIRSPKTADIGAGRLDWLGPPRRSPFAAIAWKQFRESGPLALVGITMSCAIVALIFAISGHEYTDDYGMPFELFAGISAIFGLAVAMIVGIGVFLYDVSPGLNAFWRSRPINPNLWFWTKFCSGLAVVLIAIYGLIALAAVPGIIQIAVHLATTPGDMSVYGARLTHSLQSELLVPIAITVAIFAAAAAMTCLVRNAVYAAILGVAVVYLGFVATALTLAAGRLLRGYGWPDYFGEVFNDITALQAVAGLLATFLATTLLAWLAVRYDWGKKSRY